MKQKLLQIIYKFLRFCARKYISQHKPKIIGITGSVGKTSARMIIAQVLIQLMPDKRISTSPKNFNSELGIVFSIFEIEEYTPGFISLGKNIMVILKKILFGKNPYDILVLEYGIDAPGDMKYLTSIVQPDYGVFTKLDFVHAQFFKDKEEIGAEKKILLEQTKEKIYLGKQDEYLEKIFDQFLQHKQFFPEIENIHFSQNNGEIASDFHFFTKKIQTNIFGKENLEYIALALQIAQDMGVSLDHQTYHFILKNQPGRFSIYEGKHDSILIDSSYNAAPASMKKMIENTFVLQKSVFPNHKVALVLGDMRELGEISAGKHLELNDSVLGADTILLIGPEMEVLYQALQVQSFEGELYHFKSSVDAGEKLDQILQASQVPYTVLFKGSQNTIFTEEAVKQVLKHRNDTQFLVRQSTDWLDKKQNFFKK